MNTLKTNNTDTMLGKLFFKMLPVQILIAAIGSINSIVDGVVAGRFIDAQTVGVIGLYYAMVYIYSAVGGVLLGGTSVLCGKYIGRGEHDKTEGVFSLNLTIIFLFGAVFTLAGLVFPEKLALLLGVTEVLKESLVSYIIGYSFGILPLLLSQQLALFLQLEGQSLRSYVGLAFMTLSNIFLDILLVSILKMGAFGLALATTLSNTIYLIILASYYLTKRAQLRYGIRKIRWQDTPDLVKTGIPGALLVLCIALRWLVVNRVILDCAGNDGLSAMSAFNMVSGLYVAYCLGNGSVIRMLVSVFIGEEDRSSIKKIIKIVLTKGLLLSCFVAAALFFLAPVLTGFFFPDRTSNVYHLGYQIFAIYALIIPPILICQVFTNYLQAMGHRAFVNFQSVFDGFFSVVVPSLILAPFIGAMGVWLANVVGVFLTILTVPVYCVIYWRHIPKTVDECMFFKPDFGIPEEDSLALSIYAPGEATSASEEISRFCEKHSMGKKASYFSALCLEEMAVNVLEHGFNGGKKNNLSARIIYSGGTVMLRLKDDCKPFNPGEIASIVAPEDPYENIGIRMVYKIADDVNYQNMLGLNVLTISIKEENLLSMESIDFLLEKTLKKKNPELHKNFSNIAVTSQKLLTRYLAMFSGYPDHSDLHSLTVIDFSSRLIGQKQIEKLNADEIYILLAACYLHDVGMGIGEKDYEEFGEVLGRKSYFEEHPSDTKKQFIRAYHHEFSGLFIEKYASFFEFPSPEHAFAIKQVARGHRKTDLNDEKEYPVSYALPDGNTVCLPYLASIVRLADEIDVVSFRNSALLYDPDSLEFETDIIYARRTEAVKSMKITKESFILFAQTKDEDIREAIEKMVVKMQETLDYCRDIVNAKTDFKITQKKVELNYTSDTDE
ncbi:MAG: ATP-binding protein [Lachnospiraceae bacterium]|nr:ATP-binding protein [Lachnospiraceae bacterium]